LKKIPMATLVSGDNDENRVHDGAYHKKALLPGAAPSPRP
jgi:hypothetical protein